ncbi:MAG: hypothetical protein ACI8PZ_004070, partial [Myxococcota bacterium]
MPADSGGGWRPTGRRIRGPLADLVELRDPDGLGMAVVYPPDWADEGALVVPEALAEPGVAGVAPLIDGVPGVLVYAAVEGARSVKELAELCKPDGGAGDRAALELALQLGEILIAAGEAELGRVGGLTPYTVFVAPSGRVSVLTWGVPQVEILDFVADPELVPPLTGLQYAPPESVEGAAEDESTDRFRIALAAAELWLGEPVYAGGLDDVLAAVKAGDAASLLPEDLPSLLDAVLAVALAAYPEDRHADIDGFLDSIEAALEVAEGPTLAEVVQSMAEFAAPCELDLDDPSELPLMVPLLVVPPAAPDAMEYAGADDDEETDAAFDAALARAEAASVAARESADAAGTHADRAREGADPTVEGVATLLDQADADADAALEAAERAAAAADACERTEVLADAVGHADAAEVAADEAAASEDAVAAAAEKAHAATDAAVEAAFAARTEAIEALGDGVGVALDDLIAGVAAAETLAEADALVEEARERVATAREAAEVAEREAAEAAEREAAEVAAREAAQREAVETAAREAAEREAVETAAREAAEREAAEVAAREAAEREAAEVAAREAAEREAAEVGAREAAEREAAEVAAREAAEREAAEVAAREAAETAAREAAETAAREAAEALAAERRAIDACVARRSVALALLSEPPGLPEPGEASSEVEAAFAHLNALADTWRSTIAAVQDAGADDDLVAADAAASSAEAAAESVQSLAATWEGAWAELEAAQGQADARAARARAAIEAATARVDALPTPSVGGWEEGADLDEPLGAWEVALSALAAARSRWDERPPPPNGVAELEAAAQSAEDAADLVVGTVAAAEAAARTVEAANASWLEERAGHAQALADDLLAAPATLPSVPPAGLAVDAHAALESAIAAADGAATDLRSAVAEALGREHPADRVRGLERIDPSVVTDAQERAREAARGLEAAEAAALAEEREAAQAAEALATRGAALADTLATIDGLVAACPDEPVVPPSLDTVDAAPWAPLANALSALGAKAAALWDPSADLEALDGALEVATALTDEAEALVDQLRGAADSIQAAVASAEVEYAELAAARDGLSAAWNDAVADAARLTTELEGLGAAGSTASEELSAVALSSSGPEAAPVPLSQLQAWLDRTRSELREATEGIATATLAVERIVGELDAAAKARSEALLASLPHLPQVPVESGAGPAAAALADAVDAARAAVDDVRSQVNAAAALPDRVARLDRLEAIGVDAAVVAGHAADEAFKAFQTAETLAAARAGTAEERAHLVRLRGVLQEAQADGHPSLTALTGEAEALSQAAGVALERLDAALDPAAALSANDAL